MKPIALNLLPEYYCNPFVTWKPSLPSWASNDLDILIPVGDSMIVDIALDFDQLVNMTARETNPNRTTKMSGYGYGRATLENLVVPHQQTALDISPGHTLESSRRGLKDVPYPI
jgi:hypothetical protein